MKFIPIIYYPNLANKKTVRILILTDKEKQVPKYQTKQLV